MQKRNPLLCIYDNYVAFLCHWIYDYVCRCRFVFLFQFLFKKNWFDSKLPYRRVETTTTTESAVSVRSWTMFTTIMTKTTPPTVTLVKLHMVVVVLWHSTCKLRWTCSLENIEVRIISWYISDDLMPFPLDGMESF